MSKYYKAFEKEGYMWKDLYYHTKMLVGGCEQISTKEMRQGNYEIIL